MTIHEELTASLSNFKDVKLQAWMPFFANTFPLAFYYTLATGREPTEDKWGTWSRFKEDPLENSQLFYASADEVSAFKKQNLPSGILFQDRLITRYRPRWFFVDASTEIGRRVRDGNGRLTAEALEIIDWHDGIEIVTDIPSTAKVVADYLKRLDPTLEIEIVVWNTAIQGKTTSRLKVHFFGAPRTALYRRKPQRFTSVEIPEEAFEAGPLDTHVVLAGVMDDTKIDSLITALVGFHEILFGAAKRVAVGDLPDRELRPLWDAYCKLEETSQAEMSFSGPKQYAACLHDHHYGYGASGARRVVLETPKNDPWQTHIGAGALGLGLVLPCFDHVPRLVVVQRYSGRWEALRGSREVRFSNSAGWSRVLRCVFIDEATPPVDSVTTIEALLHDQGVFAVVGNDEVYNTILENSSVISHSVGDGQSDLLHRFREIKPPSLSAIYPFENISGVGALRDELPIALMMVDRICEEAMVQPGTVSVKCEPKGSVMYYLPAAKADEACRGNPLASQAVGIAVTRLDSERRYLFERRRKRFLMNGVHYVLAALGYDVLRRRGIDPKLWATQLMPLLVSLVLSPEEKYLPIVDWFIEFQAVRLAAITDEDVLASVYGSGTRADAAWELQKWAREVLQRTAEVEDRIGRILDLRKPDKTLRKSREFLIESLRTMIAKKEEIDRIKGPRAGGIPDWFVAITSVLEAVILTQYSLAEASGGPSLAMS